MKASYTLCIVLFLTGCAPHLSASSEKKPTKAPVTQNLGRKTIQPSAFSVLKNAGLMTSDEYSKAQFIPNSNEKMIVADVREAPCRMIFIYITTKTGSYWMPNQISCSG